MKHGTVVPKGFLPVFSVDTPGEAEKLLARCCELVTYGPDRKLGWLAPELEQKQTLENLYAFGHRLDKVYREMKKAGEL